MGKGNGKCNNEITYWFYMSHAVVLYSYCFFKSVRKILHVLNMYMHCLYYANKIITYMPMIQENYQPTSHSNACIQFSRQMQNQSQKETTTCNKKDEQKRVPTLKMPTLPTCCYMLLIWKPPPCLCCSIKERCHAACVFRQLQVQWKGEVFNSGWATNCTYKYTSEN